MDTQIPPPLCLLQRLDEGRGVVEAEGGLLQEREHALQLEHGVGVPRGGAAALGCTQHVVVLDAEHTLRRTQGSTWVFVCVVVVVGAQGGGSRLLARESVIWYECRLANSGRGFVRERVRVWWLHGNMCWSVCMGGMDLCQGGAICRRLGACNMSRLGCMARVQHSERSNHTKHAELDHTGVASYRDQVSPTHAPFAVS